MPTKNKIKVLYLGNFRPPHSTENDVAASLTTLGASVTKYQEDDAISDWSTFLSQIAGIDLLMYTRTWGLPDYAKEVWKECDRNGILTAAYHLDLFFGLDREPLVKHDSMFKMAYVFTADGDHDQEFEEMGVNHHYLRAGVNTKQCREYSKGAKWNQYEVAFIGSSRRYHHNKWSGRREVQENLEKAFGDKYLLVPKHGEPATRGSMLNRLYASVPVIVGDSLSMKYSKSRYWSDRVYETLGRGGFLMFPRIDALQEELDGVPAVDWYDFGDYEMMIAKTKNHVERFRAYPELRKSLTAETIPIIRERCSYDVRVAEMLKVIGLR